MCQGCRGEEPTAEHSEARNGERTSLQQDDHTTGIERQKLRAKQNANACHRHKNDHIVPRESFCLGDDRDEGRYGTGLYRYAIPSLALRSAMDLVETVPPIMDGESMRTRTPHQSGLTHLDRASWQLEWEEGW